MLCVSNIVEIRMDCGFAIYGNIWANAMSSIVVVVVVNIRMDKKMVVDVRVCVHEYNRINTYSLSF